MKYASIIILILIVHLQKAFCQDTLRLKYFKEPVGILENKLGFFGIDIILGDATFKKLPYQKELQSLFKPLDNTHIRFSPYNNEFIVIKSLDEYLFSLPKDKAKDIEIELVIWRDIFNIIMMHNNASLIRGYYSTEDIFEPLVTATDLLLTIPKKYIPTTATFEGWYQLRERLGSKNCFVDYGTNKERKVPCSLTDIKMSMYPDMQTTYIAAYMTNHIYLMKPDDRYEFFSAYMKQVQILLKDLYKIYPIKERKK